MFEYSIKTNGIVSFTNTSTDATSYLWDFGDLTTSTSSAATIEHQYLQNGTFKATLTAYGNGKSASAFANIDVTSVAGGVPTVETYLASEISQSSATSGGNVISDGGFAVTARGICWNTVQNPTISNNKTTDGSGTGNFISYITGLEEHTVYYFRAYATNSSGTGYGEQKSFTTANGAGITVLDIDNNVYHTRTIGTQVWMVENLKVTRYRNGDLIPNVTDGTVWSNLTTGAYCNYDNDAGNATPYGRLYNWYAVNDARSICPSGWHVPTDAEWTTLSTYLGGENVAGGKLKETGNAHWQNNQGATNETGFTALPGGTCKLNGIFGSIGLYGYYWSSTQLNDQSAWHYKMNFDNSYLLYSNYNKYIGISVRCIQD